MNSTRNSANTHYEMLGGEAPLRALIKRFYHEMDQTPETQGIRAMHPQDLSSSEEKLFMFMSGWLGGPPLFVERFGHPRLRARHLPFPIGPAERDQWMHCMRIALSSLEIESALRTELEQRLYELATHMINEN